MPAFELAAQTRTFLWEDGPLAGLRVVVRDDFTVAEGQQNARELAEIAGLAADLPVPPEGEEGVEAALAAVRVGSGIAAMNERMYGFIVDTFIVEWNLHVDGQPVEPTAAAVAGVPVRVMDAIRDAINEPRPEEAAPFAPPSMSGSRATRRARKKSPKRS